MRKKRKLIDKKSGFEKYNILDMWDFFVARFIEINPGSWTKSFDKRKVDQIYHMYQGKPRLFMDYATFYSIIVRHNDLFKKKVIEGANMPLLNNMGRLQVFKIKNTENTRAINLDIKKLTGERVKADVEFYPWLQWQKPRRIKNESVYEFKPSRSNTVHGHGFTTQLFRAVRENPLLISILPSPKFIEKFKS